MGIQEKIVERAKALLADGTVVGVWGWERGELPSDRVPAYFTSAEDLEKRFVYDCLCAANISRYLNGRRAGDGKVLALLKPCDSFSFNQMLGEHRMDKDAVYALGIPTGDMIDPEKLRKAGVRGMKNARQAGAEYVIETAAGEQRFPRDDLSLERCQACKSTAHVGCDEILVELKDLGESPTRFTGVEDVEKMTPDERFKFWQSELGRCIRCNACRNVCPVCSCLKCVFDNPEMPVSGKANSESFEEKMFHIIRAFHVSGRCTDCGECSRVCPEGIPLHLLNRKFILDINRAYGAFRAGETPDPVSPLTSFKEEDLEPSEIFGN